ncbi:MAG TPA: hypothetical protein VKT28_05540 [Puia sp.]|nr:hypothetical protein [Puia sp.]
MRIKSFLSLLSICIISIHSNAQVFEKKIIPAGQSVSTFSYYLLPAFTEGVVRMKDGKNITAKMNFTLVTCDMQFIGPKGDTLSLSEPETVDSIYLQGSVFFYIFKKGYFQIPNDSLSPVRLAVFRKTSYEPVKIGAMGVPSHSTAIDNFATISDDRANTKELILNVDIYVSNQSSYYFLEKKYADIVAASKSSLLRIFKNNQDQIEEYIKANKINFSKEADLLKALQFCNTSSIPKS